MTTYPCWKYHADHAEPLMVLDAKKDAALPPGWADSPAAALAAKAVPLKPAKPEPAPSQPAEMPKAAAKRKPKSESNGIHA